MLLLRHHRLNLNLRLMKNEIQRVLRSVLAVDEKKGCGSTAMSRAVVISAILGCSVWLFLALMSLDRYRIMPVNNTNAISVYRIDQLTGDVHLCNPQSCVQVPIKNSAPAN